MDSEALSKVFKKIRVNAEFELFSSQDSFMLVNFKGADAVDAETSIHSEVRVKCIRSGKFASVISGTNSEKEMLGLLKKAYLLAGSSGSDSDGQKSFSSAIANTKIKKSISESEENFGGAIKRISSHVSKSGMNQLILSSLRYGKRSIAVANTNGSSADLSTPYIRLSTTAVLDGNDERTTTTVTQQCKDAHSLNVESLIDSAISNANVVRNAKPINSFQGAVLLSENVAASLLRSTVHALCANSIFSGNSFLKHTAIMAGHNVASPIVNVYENNSLKDSPFSRSFDDELSATSSKKLIEKGKVMSILHNIYTAEKTNVKPSGNMFYSVQPPSGAAGYGNIFTTNAILKSSGVSYDKEKLIGSIKEGIYILGIFGSINSSGSRFSLKANGYYVKNGSIIHPVKNVTVNGDLPSILNKISMIGRKKERIIDVVVPMLLIDDIDIHGR